MTDANGMPLSNAIPATETISGRDANEAINKDISYCIDANYWKGTTPQQYIEKHRRQLIFESSGESDENNE